MAEAINAKILIVEDDTLFQSMYSTRLGEEGYQVSVAGNGEEALRELEAGAPDLVLLDLMLPRLNGHEVLTRMRADERFKEIPVIILTNRGDPEEVKRGMNEGATDYLIKTTTHPRDVFWKIRQAIAAKSGQAPALRVEIRDRVLDAAQLASLAGKPADMQCAKCKTRLVLEMYEHKERPGWFDAQLVCPQCHQ
jgi:two-component system, OmpR family, phosphate regulon response regulator PhoB